jgi:hypothetical protein
MVPEARATFKSGSLDQIESSPTCPLSNTLNCEKHLRIVLRFHDTQCLLLLTLLS